MVRIFRVVVLAQGFKLFRAGAGAGVKDISGSNIIALVRILEMVDFSAGTEDVSGSRFCAGMIIFWVVVLARGRGCFGW